MDALCTSLSLNKWISSSFHCFGFSLPQECFHRAHSLNVASRFPWCLSFFLGLMCWMAVSHKGNGHISARGHGSLSIRDIYQKKLQKCRITDLWHTKLCMCLSVSVCTAECVCWWYSPGGGPWSALTRAIKVYKHEAHLSIMLTGCPHPTPLVSEPQETPTNPDPAQRAGLGHSW